MSQSWSFLIDEDKTAAEYNMNPASSSNSKTNKTRENYIRRVKQISDEISNTISISFSRIFNP